MAQRPRFGFPSGVGQRKTGAGVRRPLEWSIERSRSVVDAFELVVGDVVGRAAAEPCAFDVGSAEVEAEIDAGIDGVVDDRADAPGP